MNIEIIKIRTKAKCYVGSPSLKAFHSMNMHIMNKFISLNTFVLFYTVTNMMISNKIIGTKIILLVKNEIINLKRLGCTEDQPVNISAKKEPEML